MVGRWLLVCALCGVVAGCAGEPSPELPGNKVQDRDRDGLTNRDEVDRGLDPDDADTDDDGLEDGREVELGTDPLRADTDDDGLEDGREVDELGTDPLRADTDDDGLDDARELDETLTDPIVADTDGDRLLDGAEIDLGTDPLVADTDQDGLVDGREVDLGTDPLVADTDKDGLLDGAEVDEHGSNPLVADTDKDGLDDATEVQETGTDPTLPDTDGDGLSDADEVLLYETDPTLADTDGDGDGVPSALDCDDDLAAAWTSCGACVDDDSDGFGTACDARRDCDDDDDTVFPGASDTPGDGVDDDCSQADGPGIVDGFELEGIDPAWWDLSASSGPAYPTSRSRSEGQAALELGPLGELVSHGFDTTKCPVIAYQFDVYHYPISSTEDVLLEYWDGTAWIEVDDSNYVSGTYARYDGDITDAGAYHADFKVRLRNTDADSGDYARVDAVIVGCGETTDGDSDGVYPPYDCDDSNANHWSSCATCVDEDGDDRGDGCDLTAFDCDDTDATIYVGATDTAGDGIDQDCSGADGPDLFDDAESSDDRPGGMWATWANYYFRPSPDAAYAGQRSLLFSYTGTSESIVQDMSGCSAIDWEFAYQRDPILTPEETEGVAFDWWDSASGVWVEAFDIEGGIQDGAFQVASGTITDKNALSADFQIRFDATLWSSSTDRVYIDDVLVSCVP